MSSTSCSNSLVTQAVNVAGVGPFSEAVLCQTPCSVPAAVSNISVLKESELLKCETPADEDEEGEDDGGFCPPPVFSPSTCLGICWDPPCDHGSEITSYLIDLGEKQPVVVGPVTKHIIQHLQPDTSYRSEHRCSRRLLHMKRTALTLHRILCLIFLLQVLEVIFYYCFLESRFIVCGIRLLCSGFNDRRSSRRDLMIQD